VAASFGDILAEKIKAKGWTVREFARRSSSNDALVSRVIRAKRSPPLARLDAWAAALGLSGADRIEFIERGRLAVCPPEIVTLIAQLRIENARLKARLAETTSRSS